MVTLNNLI